MAVGQEMPELWGSRLGHSRILRFWFHSQKGSRARIYENGYNAKNAVKYAFYELAPLVLILDSDDDDDDDLNDS